MAQMQEAPQKLDRSPMVLTHGTLEIQDVQKSMHFYGDFLGLDVIQHVPFGCRISLGGPFYIVCLEVKHEPDMPILNHFGLDCASRAEVDTWYERAVAGQEEFELTKITRPCLQHGAYAFYVRDRDRNWWEIQTYERDSREAHLEWGQTRFANAARAKSREEQPPAMTEATSDK